MSESVEDSRVNEEIAKAEKNFIITEDAQSSGVRYLSATADTGWRYSIAISTLPGDGEALEGGPMLVTVTSPWTDAWALQKTGYLDVRYVDEHLSGSEGRYSRSSVDIAILTWLIRRGLDRQ